MNKRWTRRLLLALAAVVVIVPAVMAAAWVGTESMIEQTSDAEFCTTCHTMEPFATAHAQDVHGGNNPGGVVAACTDCHLPHDNAAHHLFAKATTGARDLMAQSIYFLHKPDWLDGLHERSEYVYDSGCLSCHAALKDATSDDPRALTAHKAYFAGDLGEGCVECHAHVGHDDLEVIVADHFDEVRLPDASPEHPLSEDAGDGSEAAATTSAAAPEDSERAPEKEGSKRVDEA